jgi:hypothetical protein
MAGDSLSVQGGAVRSAAAFAGADAQASGESKEAEGAASTRTRTTATSDRSTRKEAAAAETKYTQAKTGSPKAGGTGTNKVKQRSAKDLKTKKLAAERAMASFSGVKATAEARQVSAQEVSERLSQIPSGRRGAEAAELLGRGGLSSRQVAGYVAGAEGGNTSVRTALGRAAALLSSSDDPGLRKAIAEGLDWLVPSSLSRPGEPSAAEKDIVHRLEGQLKSFLDGERLGPEAKHRVLDALGQHSAGPTLRSAATVALSQHTAELKLRIEQSRRDLEASYDPHNLRNIPGGLNNVTNLRMGLERQLKEAEGTLASSQAGLGTILEGPKDWQVDPRSDPNVPQTSAGHLANYLEKYHTHQQLPRAKEVVRALFDPPSATSAEGFAKMTERVKAANQLTDGKGLGFLVEAGHQAFAVEPAKERREAIQQAASVAQIALAAGLGYAGVLASEGWVLRSGRRISRCGRASAGWVRRVSNRCSMRRSAAPRTRSNVGSTSRTKSP